MKRTPDFENILRILDRQAPKRPTLFEFSLYNQEIFAALTSEEERARDDELADYRRALRTLEKTGFDCAVALTDAFTFPRPAGEKMQTRSLNDGQAIGDRASFDAYDWPNPDTCDYSILERIACEAPDGMKIVVGGAGGVLENVIDLVGFERLCIMSMMDPELTADLFEAVGSRFVRYYEIVATMPFVGACVSNDDWGFKGQTMLAPDEMRRYVFPYHKRIVEAIHAAGKPAILHSCGNLEAVMDDIIDDMNYDGKHSYEDAIMPVEEAYERWGDRIAILGGIDVDFLARKTPEEIRRRGRAMLDRTASRGGYALGSGNSIPDYIPAQNFFAMTDCARRECSAACG